MSEQIDLLHFLALPSNWDSFGASPITQEAVKMAEGILRWAKPIEPQGGQVIPRNTGGLQIEWHCGGWDVEIFCDANGSDGKVLIECKGIRHEVYGDFSAYQKHIEHAFISMRYWQEEHKKRKEQLFG